MADSSIIFVLDASMPFIRNSENPGCYEESILFDALSFTYLPLLRSCTALESEGISFKFAIAFSPILCEMLSDPLLQSRYIEYLDASIDYGLLELERCKTSVAQQDLAKLSIETLQLNRRDFVEIYENNILKKFDYFATHGYIEILATSASPCFLPMYADIPEALSAQIEIGLLTYRAHFTAIPTGFWLPAMAYAPGLEKILKAYGFQYTFLETHGVLFADPSPKAGIFQTAVCNNGLALFTRDRKACLELTDPKTGFIAHAEFLNTERDIGFELEGQVLAPLFDISKGRRHTGFRYHSKKDSPVFKESLYEPIKAHQAVYKFASSFLNQRLVSLSQAASLLEDSAVISTCAFPATFLGGTWAEGISWLEQVFRQASSRRDISFSLPAASVLVDEQSVKITPCFSSWFSSGYAEEVLNNSNDWMYRYVRKAIERMIDLAGRFPEDSGLKERTLNMAAREILLAQTLDWFIGMSHSEEAEYSRQKFEENIRAFTVVYESLGSNFISTEWLTNIEKVHNLFKTMNYRVFSHRQ